MSLQGTMVAVTLVAIFTLVRFLVSVGHHVPIPTEIISFKNFVYWIITMSNKHASVYLVFLQGAKKNLQLALPASA
jgi:hypothetical protein